MAESEISGVYRSYNYRLRPTKAQHARLEELLEAQRHLYNACLEHRNGAYRRGKFISMFEQMTELTELRNEDEYWLTPVNIQRWTLKNVERAYAGFFSRVKSGKRPGFPRFRNEGRWRSFGFSNCDGMRIRSERIMFKSLPGKMKMHVHRPMPQSKPLCCTFTKGVRGWLVSIQFRVPVVALPRSGSEVGIDMGVKKLCVLSSGEQIANQRTYMKMEPELRRRQRALSRCIKGSKRRQKMKERVGRCHDKIREARRTRLHQISAKLVREHDRIVVEALNLKALNAGMLSKSANDAGWGLLRQMLEYKAESAGKTVVAVDPKRTSQECSGCGSLVMKPLSQRTHSCPDCGLVLDRDHNAAINILTRGRTGSQVSQREALACA